MRLERWVLVLPEGPASPEHVMIVRLCTAVTSPEPTLLLRWTECVNIQIRAWSGRLSISKAYNRSIPGADWGHNNSRSLNGDKKSRL
ncbi:hypothetical protein ABHI18_012141 [Aspergillus niger]